MTLVLGKLDFEYGKWMPGSGLSDEMLGHVEREIQSEF
jgi:hypothetical protein